MKPIKLLAVIATLSGCSAIQLQKAKGALETCGSAAVLAEANNLLPVLGLLLENQPTDMSAQLTALEGVSEAGVLCGLEQIASAPTPPAAPAMVARANLRLAPSDKARAAALKFLLQ